MRQPMFHGSLVCDKSQEVPKCDFNSVTTSGVTHLINEVDTFDLSDGCIVGAPTFAALPAVRRPHTWPWRPPRVALPWPRPRP